MSKYLIIAVLLVGIAIPAHAEAAGAGILGCGAASGALAVASGAGALAGLAEVPVNDRVTRTATTEVSTKECILDGVVVALREALVASITESIVNWINSGFEGSPAFVTDLGGFLTNIADEVAGDFILGSDLGFLCSPFELEVRIALAMNYQKTYRQKAECTLTEVSGNVEKFLSGDFSSGGWPAWFKLHIDPQNNPYRAYLEAEKELTARIVNAQGQEIKLLEFGDGFFSKRECVRYGSDGTNAQQGRDGTTSGTTTKTCLEYKIVTPGTQINEQLGDVLGSGFRQLELADELDEIIGALLSQLAQQALTGLSGLSGLSSGGSDNKGSYLSQLTDEARGGSVQAGKTALVNDIEGAIEIQEDYQAVTVDMLSTLAITKTSLSSVYTCYTASSIPDALSIATTASTTLATQVTPQIKSLGIELTVSEQVVEDLQTLLGRAGRATKTNELNAVAESYESLIASGKVQTPADLSVLLSDRDQNKQAFDALVAANAVKLQACGVI